MGVTVELLNPTLFRDAADISLRVWDGCAGFYVGLIFFFGGGGV